MQFKKIVIALASVSAVFAANNSSNNSSNSTTTAGAPGSVAVPAGIVGAAVADWLPQALKDRNEGEEVNQEQNFECVQNLGDEIIEMPIDKNVNVGETLNDGENTHNVIQEFRRAIYCLEQNGRCENIIRWLKRELLARFSGRNSGMGVEYPRN